MPKTCCVTGCRSGYRGTQEKASLFCLPSDAEQREIWKRAIPRQESGGFSFDSKHVRVCEKHFDPTDIIRTDEFVVNGESVSLQREKLKLSPGAVPRIFEGLPAYLSKPKPRPRTLRVKRPAKILRKPSEHSTMPENFGPSSAYLSTPAHRYAEKETSLLRQQGALQDRPWPIKWWQEVCAVGV